MVDDPTFPWRVAAGVSIFAALGLNDLWRNPRDPRRLKEYLFLFGVTGATIAYGLVHDAITFSLGPEYFGRVKGVAAGSFFPEVAKLAAMASWTAGLTIGLVMLVANNPSPRLSQLRYSELMRLLRMPFAASLASALLLAACARAAPGPWLQLTATASATDESAHRLITVWAVHIGTYAGAILGLGVTAAEIRRRRRRQGASSAPTEPAHVPSREPSSGAP